MRDLVISTSNIRKRFVSTASLDGLDLAVPAGAVFGFLGPNGAGKTTTLRALLGLVRIDSGEISVLGLNPSTQAQQIRPPADRRARIQEVLEQMRLWDRRGEMVVTWSKGMRQRLAIARALLHRPRLLLLDEPFSGLDPEAAVELRGQISALGAQGMTVFLTTHDLAHVEKICSEAAVLLAGRAVAVGSPAALARRSPDLELEATGEGLTDELLETLRAEQFVLGFDRYEDVVRIRCTRDHRGKIGPELVRRGVLLQSLTAREASLEEAFLSLVRERAAK